MTPQRAKSLLDRDPNELLEEDKEGLGSRKR